MPLKLNSSQRKDMLKSLIPYANKIAWLNNERKKVSSTRINPSSQYYNTKVYNQMNSLKKIDKQISKTTKQMNSVRSTKTKAMVSWNKLLKKSKA